MSSNFGATVGKKPKKKSAPKGIEALRGSREPAMPKMPAMPKKRKK